MSVRKSWAQEMESAYLYEVLADSDSSPERRALFAQLAGEAKAQAAIWAAEVQKIAGETPEGFRPSARARFVAVLVRRLGPERLRSVLAGMKVRGMSVYRALPAPSGHAMPHSVEEVGRSHRDHGGGDNLRPAVFGASDGLVSNVCLILGVAGASASNHTVLITGVAGLAGGRLLDGGRRVRLGAVATRDVRASDRRRAGRAPAVSGAGGGRAVAHLPGARAGEARRRPGVRPPDRRSGPGAGHAGARGAGARSGRARIAGWRGAVVVRVVRGRRRGSAGAVPDHRRAAGRSARR